ncbi:lipopolysaccharide 1,6-galactosyltransferase [Enterobacteriaceae bacterium]
MKKIAFVGEAVSGFGGMETVIRDVIHAFRADTPTVNSKMFFFCRDDRMDKGWLEGIDADYAFSNHKISFLRRARHVRALARWLREEKPDVVICIDVISCLLANRARQKSGLHFPLFSWPHFSLDHKKHAECVTYADYHLAISSGIKQQMIARGVPEARINVIFNPVAPKNTVIPAPAAGEAPTFLYVGRMKFEGQKRIKDLLDGLAALEGPWTLHAIGDGSDFEKCRRYASEKGIADRITWHGWQAEPWTLVQRDIKRVSALLLTSSFEGFPMTLLEAMSYGIFCISSDCMSGPGDMIVNGVNGQLYPPGDVSAFTAALSGFTCQPPAVDPATIQHSIHRFYIDAYFENVKAILRHATETTIQ